MKYQPPRLARKFFELFAGSAHVDDLLGDLDEWFYLNLETKSPFKAKMLYWKQIFSLSFSYALKKRKLDVRFSSYSSSSLSVDMLRNYVKVAVRNLRQYKYFSFLNAFGLAIGMSISLLLISVYSYVSTYDNFHTNREKIYTVISTRIENVAEIDYALAPAVLADKIEEEFTGAEKVVRIIRGYEDLVKTEKENIPVKSYYVEPDFFAVFTFEMIQGQAAALNKPYQVILTQSAAKKLFNEENVIGKTFELDGGRVLEVAGLMKDHPANSHLNFEMLVSYSTIPESKLSLTEQWTDFEEQFVYVMLRAGASPDDLEAYLDQVEAKTYAAQAPVKYNFELQHLEDIVMGPDLRNSIGVKWEASGFIMFGIFAALILLPACFNYANISIARAMRRAKEIGLRKTLGGVKSQVFLQFITETVVITLVSFLGSLLIFVVIRAEFQSMMVAGSSLDLSLGWRMMTMFSLFALVTGLLAGIFPALHFSGLNPIQALKNKVSNRGSSLRVRKVLTIFQFALSFGFILSLVVFSKQYRYSLNFDFGFEKKNTVDVQLQDVDQQQFKAAFSQLAPVKSISMSSGLLGVNWEPTWIKTEGNDSTEVGQLHVDHNYIPNMGLELLAGKNFPDEQWQRERYIIVNEEFLKFYKIRTPMEALGKIYTIDGQDLEIIGVLKNFHYAPLQYPIEKFFFRMNPSRFYYANLQVTSTDAYNMFTQMEAAWKQLPTQKKFSGKFFEDELNEAYYSYRTLLKVIGFLGLLAITISLLGMLGMVVYTAEIKIKEVGIRKVMGATVTSIALLLSKDYLKMMGWAVLVAIPATAFLLNLMLTEIQYYSVNLSVWDVLVSTVFMLGLGVLTIASQTYKTAMTNPATTLRSE
ncbi:MAG: ABC transporter permease [Bacteroidota bacterium]